MGAPEQAEDDVGGVTAEARGSLEKLLHRAFAVMGLLIVSIGLLAVGGLSMTGLTINRLVDRDDPAIRANAAMLQALTDAETAERGYLITGDARFLTSFNESRPRVRSAFAEGRKLAAGNRGVLRALEVEEELATAWLRDFAEPVVELRDRDEEAAAAMARTGAGRRRFARFRAANEVSAGLLVDRRDEDRRWAEQLERAATAGSVALVFLGTGIAAVVANRTTRAVTRQRRAVEVAQAAALEGERQVVAQLRELDRTRQGLVSSVSHELRTPLTSITGYLELLSEGEAGALNPDQLELFAVVERNARRLLALIEDILTLSRVEAGEFRLTVAPTDVGDIAAAVHTAMLPVASRQSLTLTVLVDPDVALIEADGGQLERVLLNLVSNAVKFTPPGGRVSLRVTTEDDDVVVIVADTGMGIPASEQERIFSPFFRSSSAHRQQVQGTGLGLAIVHTIVQRHGGSIVLESVEGEGTVVTVRIRSVVGATMLATVGA